MKTVAPGPAVKSQSIPAASAKLTVECIDPLNGSDWEALVDACPEAGVFYGTAWARVLARTWGHVPRYLVFSRLGRPCALLPLMDVRSPLTGRRGISLPFSDMAGFLTLQPGDPGSCLPPLLQIAADMRWRTIELRGGPPPAPGATPSGTWFAHSLDLTPGPDALFRQAEGSVRRSIRRAERSGLTAAIRTDRDAIPAFARLHARTRRRHGLPPQPEQFFHAIHRELIEPGDGFISLVSDRSGPVAAAVILLRGDRAVFKFGASDERHLEARPNHLAIWTAIRWLSNGGAVSLDFGRTAASTEGLRRFKRSWGTRESRLHYWKYHLPTSSWVTARDHSFGIHNAFFSRLPLSANRLIGAALYPHLD